jgi:hypothetical protein
MRAQMQRAGAKAQNETRERRALAGAEVLELTEALARIRAEMADLEDKRDLVAAELEACEVGLREIRGDERHHEQREAA